MLIIAFVTNVILVICEALTLGHIRSKRDIFKYYTYLQNCLALITSLVFSVCWIVCTVSHRAMPEFAKGLRYVATCGLLSTTLVFILFLGAGKKIAITEKDFLLGFDPKAANITLHYICPALSLVSFLLFEREIPLSNGIWTAIVAIPSCIYWLTYIILSAAKLWEAPYDFTAHGKKSNVREILSVASLPLSFIAISFILWSVQ